jgi:plasmid stabilization system protein ParE
VSRYVLSPEAVEDLDAIKATLIARGDKPLARYVLRALRLAMQFLADTPGAGHSRSDLTDDVVKFCRCFHI